MNPRWLTTLSLLASGPAYLPASARVTNMRIAGLIVPMGQPRQGCAEVTRRPPYQLTDAGRAALAGVA